MYCEAKGSVSWMLLVCLRYSGNPLVLPDLALEILQPLKTLLLQSLQLLLLWGRLPFPKNGKT